MTSPPPKGQQGNFEKAEALVRERGIVIAEKKEGRKTGAGLLKTYVHNNRVGVLLEIRAETDFAVRDSAILRAEEAVHLSVAEPFIIHRLFHG